MYFFSHVLWMAQVLDNARSQQVAPDVLTYNHVLKACISMKDWVKAEDLLQQMVAEKVIPDYRTHDLMGQMAMYSKTTLEGVKIEEDLQTDHFFGLPRRPWKQEEEGPKTS